MELKGLSTMIKCECCGELTDDENPIDIESEGILLFTIHLCTRCYANVAHLFEPAYILN